MASAAKSTMPLMPGDKLTRPEFMRRWEDMPDVKKAELIGGIVYMPSPLSRKHGNSDIQICYWLEHYAMHTPGCEAGANSTWLMKKDAPQPDVSLRLLPEYGGHSHTTVAKELERRTPRDATFLQGAPELIVEICFSSTSYDQHQKKDLYESSGVDEYVSLLVNEEEVIWRRLEEGKYERLAPSAGQIFKSRIFPGLWLNAAALLKDDMLEVVKTLNQGLASPEYQRFRRQLVKKGS